MNLLAAGSDLDVSFGASRVDNSSYKIEIFWTHSENNFASSQILSTHFAACWP